jgi:hypothetical protein
MGTAALLKGTQFVTNEEQVLYGSVATVAHEWHSAASPPSFAHGAASVTAASPPLLPELLAAPELLAPPELPAAPELLAPPELPAAPELLAPPELLAAPELLPLLDALPSLPVAGAGLLALLHATTSVAPHAAASTAVVILRSKWFVLITAPRNSRSGT